MVGAPKFAASQDLPDVSYAGFAAQPRARGDRDPRSRRDRPGLGEGAGRRPPDGAGRAMRPRRPAHPAARHLGRRCATGQGDASAATRTPGGAQDRNQAKGPGVPARQQGQRAMRRSDKRRDRRGRSAGRCMTSAPAASSGAWPGWPRPARLITAAEIFTEHDGASFGNKMMWWPIVIVPTMVPAGVAAVFSRRAAKTVLPVASAVGRGQRAAGHVPALAGHPAEAGRQVEPALQHRDGPARCSRRCWPPWWAAWACWPPCCAAKASGEWPAPFRRLPSAVHRSRRAARAASPASTSSPRWTAGITSPPGWSWPAWTPTPAVVLHRQPRSRPPGPARSAAGPGRRTAGAGAGMIDKRLGPARPTAGTTTTCPKTARRGGTAWPPSTTTPDAVHASTFIQLAARAAGRAWSRRSQDADRWHGFDAKHVWSLWTRYACAAFYSHPWAWNEIGFGGPAYPRGLQEHRRRPPGGVGTPRRRRR